MSHHPERTARNVRPVNQPPSFSKHCNAASLHSNNFIVSQRSTCNLAFASQTVLIFNQPGWPTSGLVALTTEKTPDNSVCACCTATLKSPMTILLRAFLCRFQLPFRYLKRPLTIILQLIASKTFAQGLLRLIDTIHKHGRHFAHATRP